MASPKPNHYLRVLYDYQYMDSEGNPVKITAGDECLLLKKATAEWWFVVKKGEKKSIYVPANYVEDLHKTVITLCENEGLQPKRKGPPPKPPAKPKIKPSVEEEVLKELDLVLDLAFTDDPVFENGRGVESNERSNSSSENVDIRGGAQDNSSDSEPDYENSLVVDTNRPIRNLRESLRPVSNIYGTDSRESMKKKEYAGETGGSMHRKLTKTHSAGSSKASAEETKGSAEGSKGILEKKASDAVQEGKRNSGENKRLNRYSYEELPTYSNLPSLGIQVNKHQDSLPQYANLAEIQAAIHSHPDPPKPLEGNHALRNIDSEWDEYIDDETTRHYYYNKMTESCSWKPPRGWQPYKEESEIPSPVSRPHSLEDATEGTVSASGITEEQDLAASEENSLDFSLESKPKSPVRITEKKGSLNKAKVMENWKKVKKNWSQSYVVTTGRKLYFYKDQKAANVKPLAPQGKPEAVLDLHGATIEFGSKEKSSKKNIIQVTSSSGTEFLLQTDKDVVHEWYQILKNNVSNLPPTDESMELEPAGKKKWKKATSSLERPHTPEDGAAGEKSSKLRDWLLNWLKKRPTLESLEAKGIYKYTVFGSHLITICDRENVQVPIFVTRCISAIENKGLSSDGLYRISGNLAQIQKVRFCVDLDDQYDLETVADWDIHVLTGSLKLFFRELREPLVPFNFFDKFIKAAQMKDRSQKLDLTKQLIKVLPDANRHTMSMLFAHLSRVMSHSKENRMQVQNLAIVFGPTLMWPQEAVTNVAVSMVYQNQTVDFILQEFENLF